MVIARIVFAVFAYLSVLVVLYAVGLTLESRTGPLIGLAFAEAGAFGVVLLIWRFIDRRPIPELGLRRELARPLWLRGALVGALMMSTLVVGWYTLLWGSTWTTNDDLAHAALVLAAGFIGFFIQGPAEEVLFRGYVLSNLRARWGIRWAIGVSSVAFSLLHAPNPAYGALPALNLTLFGVAMALYRVRWDGDQLWGVFAIHTMWNWLQQVVFGLPNSGNLSPVGDVLFSVAPNPALPDFVTGGGFGPEGTLGATIVLSVLIWATLRQGTVREPSRSE